MASLDKTTQTSPDIGGVKRANKRIQTDITDMGTHALSQTRDEPSNEIYKSETKLLQELNEHAKTISFSQTKSKWAHLFKGQTDHNNIASIASSIRQKAGQDYYGVLGKTIVDATKFGDINQMYSLLDQSTEEDIATLSAALIGNAVGNDDYEMLNALLQHYQNALKSNAKRTELDNLCGCLVECVYKNKPQMTYALVNAVIDTVHNSKEIFFKDLVIASIQRGCDVSLVQDIAKLWISSFGISTNTEVRANALIKILRDIHSYEPDVGVYIYTIFNLSLLEINEKIGKNFWKNIQKEKIKEVFKHKRHVTCGSELNRPYINYLLSKSDSLEDFIAWHNEGYNLGGSAGLSPEVAIQEVFLAIQKEDGEEEEQIRACVHQFMEKLCNEMQNIEPILQCVPNQVGSAREKTRNFHPNEFDYELLFQELPSLFKVMKFENSFFFRLSSSPKYYSKVIRSWLFKFQEKWYLNPDAFKASINGIIQEILKSDKSLLREPFKCFTSDSKLCCDGQLSVEPFGHFTEKVKFSCMTLQYYGKTGSKRKYLPISIDLIPTLECDIEIEKPVHSMLKNAEATLFNKSHIIAYGDPVGFQLGFSRYENHIIGALPKNLKEGYRLAKGVRCILSLCHEANTKLDKLKNESCVERITTYMLKTMVLVITGTGLNEKVLSMTSRRFAYEIYKRLLDFLRKDKRIPHFFLNQCNNEGGECLFQIEFNRNQLRERECIYMIEDIKEILTALTLLRDDLPGTLVELGKAVNITKEKTVILKGHPFSLRLIHNRVWWCGYACLGAFDQTLEHIIDMQLDFAGLVTGVEDVAVGLVVSAQKGLFLISYSGDLVTTISSESFSDVCRHDGLIYATPIGDSVIHVYTPGTWKRLRILSGCPSDCEHVKHTVRATIKGITLACSESHCIHLLDYSGKLRQTHGTHGEEEGQFNWPFLCGVESDGTMLVADQFNNRCQVLYDDKWRTLPLHQPPESPMGAVATSKTLYIATWENQLTMYKTN